MSALDSIGKPADAPIICTISGDAGTGKTRLAATFPKPIFIRAEDGLQSVPQEDRPDAFPVLSDQQQVWDQIKALLQEEHDYKTLVIDSVTQLDTLFIQHILASDPKKPASMAQAMGGYGAGFQVLSGMHARIRKAAGMLRENKGMHVVFIAHSETSTIELPDQDPYTRYDIRLHKKSVQHYVDNVDLVGFMKLETFTTGDGDRKKAISDGTRIMTCYTTAAHVSKNRFGIKQDLHVDEGSNPLTEYVSTL